MRRLLTFVLMLAYLRGDGLTQDFQEDFETGVRAAQSYHKAADELKIEWCGTHAASGQHYARAVLPGQKALEGFSVTAGGLKGPRLAQVTAQVRGEGEIWLCLLSRNGWLYAPETKRLTDQWQEVSLSKVLVAQDTSLGIHFLSRTAQPGAIFEVDGVRVALAPPVATLDEPAGPWRFAAASFTPNPRAVKQERQALAGRALVSNSQVIAAGIPFPRTTRPVTLYGRVRAGDGNDSFRVVTRQGGQMQTLCTAKPAKLNGWEWLTFKPVLAGEAGDCFGVCSYRKPGARGEVALDSVVLATAAGLRAGELDTVPELFGQRPLAGVSRCTTAPAIDGKPDDACWQQTIACTGFMVLGNAQPAHAATSVRFCYDAANLYALFECQEPVLVTAQQRRHEFKAKVAERDGTVSSDDSVILLLDPAADGQLVYDFTLNSLGTVADALDKAPDWWNTRDPRWNSSAHAAGAVDEGKWHVEFSVPLSELGGAPEPGRVWHVSLGRIAACRGEVSTWNVCGAGIHAPVAPGALVFLDSPPGVTLQAPPSLQPGRNRLTALLSAPGPGGVYLHTRLASPALGAGQISYFRAECREAIQDFDVATGGDVRISHAVLNAATLQPLYLTPEVARGVRSALATLRLATPGPYEVYVNESLAAWGDQAEAAKIEVQLQKGANVLALRLQQGTAALRGQAGELTFDAAHWRMAAPDAKGALAVTTDDAAWPVAPMSGEHPELGAIVGQPGQPAVLRRTLLLETTRVWPTPEPAWHLARGAPQHLTFVLEGLKGRKLANWQTFLAVPPQFEVVGCTGFYGNTRPDQPRFVCTQLGEQQLRGRAMRVARIDADQPIRSGRHFIMSELEVLVRYRDEVGEPAATDAQFAYWSQACDGSVIEPPQSVNVRVLPRLEGAQCKSLVWQLWGGWFSNMDDFAMREQILECCRQAGFNDIVSGDRWTSDNANRYGLKHTMGVSFEPWSLNLAPYLEGHPDQRRIGADGKPDGRRMCPALLLGEGWQAVRQALEEKLESVRPDTLDYDYEHSPANGPHSCYCPRCLQAFRDDAKLPTGTSLDAATIQAQYWTAWVDFMARRVARLFGQFRQTVHEFSPTTRFSVYSGYQTPDNPERYGVDWRYVGQGKGADRAGCGYGRPVEAIRATVASLQGIPLLCGALLVPYEHDVLTPVSPYTKAWLLRTLIDSTGGLLAYDRLPFDGRSWYAVAETTRLVAAYEKVFLAGRRLGLPNLDPSQVQLLQLHEMSLVCLLNGTAKPLTIKVQFPGELGSGREYFSGTPVSAGETRSYTLAPGDAEVAVLEKLDQR